MLMAIFSQSPWHPGPALSCLAESAARSEARPSGHRHPAWLVALLAVLPHPSGFAQSLAEAVDQPALPWSTSGDQPWFGQTDFTHDGQDAAQSGALGDLETGSLSTTVTGPINISFWWRVSSESGFDFYDFKTNGAIHNTLTGESGWQPFALALPAGTHLLSWVYEKDDIVSGGHDSAWLDEVVLTTGPLLAVSTARLQLEVVQGVDTFPKLLTLSAWNVANAAITLTAQTDQPWVSANWNDSVSSGPSDKSTLTLTVNWSSLPVGEHQALITIASAGVANSPLVIPLRVQVSTPLDLALDTVGTSPTLPWQSESPAWFGQTAVSFDGVDAARSARITHLEESRLQVTVEEPVYGQAILAFRWKVSSEAGKDTLEVEDNLVLLDSISGQTDWEEKYIYITDDQEHDIVWFFTKDTNDTGPVYEDAGYVDDVRWITDVRLLDTPEMPGGSVFRQPDQPLYLPGSAVSLSATPLGSHSFAGWYDFFGSITLPDTTRPVVLTNSLRTYALFGQSFPPTALDTAHAGFSSWLHGGHANWFSQSVTSTDAFAAWQSGQVGNNQISWFQTTVSGPGQLGFFWKVSSENGYDFLSFHLDDELQEAISGEVDWQWKTIAVPSGLHRLTWVYSKDIDLASGADAGWVDGIIWPALETYASWKTNLFSPAELANPQISGPLADPQKTGLNNLLRYAFHLDRTQSTSPDLPAPGVAAVQQQIHPTLSFTLRHNDPSLSWRVEWSDDLVTWRHNQDGSGQTYVTYSLLDLPDGTRKVVATATQPLSPQLSPSMRVRLLLD